MSSIPIGFVQRMSALVRAVYDTNDLSIAVEHLALALREEGIPVERLQIPLSQLFGLKHPFYFGIIATWTLGGQRKVMYRERINTEGARPKRTLAKSPYRKVALAGESFTRYRIGTAEWTAHAKLVELQDEGFVDYAVAATVLPDGARQILSVATTQHDAFPEDLEERLLRLMDAAAPALFSVYQLQAMRQLSAVYLGHTTGSKALSGLLTIGDMEDIHAIVAFMDLRDFTATMNTLGSQKTLRLVNAAFDSIDRIVNEAGGEILKLIGDAALVVFRLYDIEPERQRGFARAAVQACLDASDAVEHETEKLGHRMRLGVGLHHGTVQYGNIGSKQRRDFTVVGPVVNLASRLEMITKTRSATLAMSEAAASLCGVFEDENSYVGSLSGLDARFERSDGVEVPGYSATQTIWSVPRSF
jgi:adenylate cyclase